MSVIVEDGPAAHGTGGTAAGGAEAATGSILEVRNVDFGYGGPLILDDVSFFGKEGEFLSIIGPSGWGKSTLLTLLDGMAVPLAGEVAIDGKPPRLGDRSRAMVFQTFALMPWSTVLQNVALALKYRRPELGRAERVEIAMHYLGKVGLAASRDLYPRSLSGGMQQRVGLARAFAVQPRILLMDEPFGALDAQNAEILRDEVRHLVAEESRTVVFVTHNLDEAISLSDRVLLMTAGPGRIREEVRIELPERKSPAYREAYDAYRDRLWEHLRVEVEKAQAKEREEVDH